MSEPATSILVISNPEDRDEVLEPLLEAGYQHLVTGDGGDDSFTAFEQLGPDVVILCANLDQGDARALIAAMRDDPHGEVAQIILIGEVHGPIRNALDAVDLAVDRFLGRPLSAKALVFCVRTCARAAADVRARRAAALVPEATQEAPPAADESDELEIEVYAPEGFDGADEPEIEVYAPEGFDGADDTAEMEVDSLASDVSPGAGDTTRMVLGAPDVDEEGEALAAGAWDEPPAPAWREPTVILPDGGAEAPDLGPAHEPAVGAPAAVPDGDGLPAGEAASVQGDDGWLDAALVLAAPPVIGDDGARSAGDLTDDLADALADDLASDLADDFSGRIDDELEADLERALVSDSDLDVHIADLTDGSQGGGEFAQALRRKMSAMAERLFPGQHAGAAGAPEAAEARGRGQDEAQGEIQDEVLADVLEGREVEAGSIRCGEADAVTLIERMYRERITGRITFRRDHARKSVLFERGRPVFASSNLPEDRLGALLYREGKISDAQHDQGYARAIESGKRMGEVLVEMGYLKRREILPTVRRHLEDMIYSLFAWDTGEYEVMEGAFAAGERIRLSRHPAAMILEGVRRKLDQDTLVALVGAPSSVVEIVDDRQRKTVVSVADLSPAERKVIAWFDGERSLAGIAERASIGLLPIYQLAYGLIALQAAQIVQRGDEAVAEDAEADSEAEDAIDMQRVLAKLQLVSEADYFALLGVRRDATGFEIQRAYEAARQDFASEVFSPAVRRDLAEELAEINEMLDEAYRVLRDDALRHAYLRNLRD